MTDVNWLPDLERLSDYGGCWDDYLQMLYEVFCEDFVNNKPCFRGKKLGLKRQPITSGKEATFWHLISQGKVEAERTPCFRRCERIRWPSPIIGNSYDSELKVWAEPKGKQEQRIHIWFEAENYLVVLADRGKYILPWTAFYIEHDHQNKKYEKRWVKFGGL